MINKSIIIDGVDVSECEKINTCSNKIKCVILQDDVCEINPYCEGYNCYYKQLKRKEQECEELKSKIKHYKQIAQHHGDLSVKYTNKSAKLKQALSKIKEIIKWHTTSANSEDIQNDMKRILQLINEAEL